MSTPNKEQLLAEIAQFLTDEQEVYGPFTFTTKEEEEIMSHLESEDEGEDEGRGANDSEGKGKGADDSEGKDEGKGEPEQNAITDSVDPSGLIDKPNSQKTISLKERLEACQNLEQLQQFCKEADELRTDLEGTRLVFGVGNPHASLMLIGEAPGEQEDIEGEPFVGAAGQLLNKILAAIDFKRDEVYIANILKHRPPGNRNPSQEERLRSLPYLLRQIDLIQPKLILCLGKVSGTTLLDRDDSLKNLRGEFYPFRNSLLTVTYHPAALLRNPKWKRPVWEDVQKVKKKVVELSAGGAL